MRIQVSEHPVSGDRAHFKQEYRQRVEDVVNELDDVTDRERRQINVCRRRHWLLRHHDQNERVTHKSKRAQDGVADESRDELGRVIELTERGNFYDRSVCRHIQVVADGG